MTAAMLLSISPAAHAGPTNKKRARVAVRYIVNQQRDSGAIVALSKIGSTADAVVSMVAARRAPGAINDALGFLERKAEGGKVDTVGEKAKVVLAAVAGGRDARDFGGHNLVREIKSSQQPDGQYGSDQAGVFSHALAILALVGADADVPRVAMQWLAGAQCDDGGWQYDEPAGPSDSANCIDTSSDVTDWVGSDTNTSGYAVQAWNARPSTVPLKADPFDFFRSARDEIKGGWVYDPTYKCDPEVPAPFCFVTDTNSTALVLQAYAAERKDAPPRGVRALKRLQYPLCGETAGAFAFSWKDEDQDGTFETKDSPNLGATIAGVLGVLERPLPISYAKVTKPAPKPGSC
jgi:hypothetical protein